MADFDRQKAIVTKIDKLAESEKITKSLLGELSRELLEYVPDTNDIGMVNRLTAILTPVNKKVALLFFKHFLPWQMDDAGVTFLGKDKSDKRVAKKLDAIKTALADPEWNIWVWAESNIEVEKKDFDLKGYVKSAVELALKGKKESKGTKEAEPISPALIMTAVFEAGVKAEDVLELVTMMAATSIDTAEEDTSTDNEEEETASEVMEAA